MSRERLAPALDLRAFLAALRAAGELQRVAVPVDPDLEVAAISEQVGRSGGPALLFEQLRGSRVPLLTNLFGTPRRAALALGAESAAAAAARLAALLAAVAGDSGSERLQRLQAEARWAPRPAPLVARAVAADLAALPALRGWPGDGGRHFTLPLVITRDAESGAVNVGLYRIQRLGPRRAAIRWQEQSDAARHHRSWQRRGAAMPVAVVLGAPPALLCAAAAPLPADGDDFAAAGLLAGGALTCAAGEDGLPLPANAEIVLTGTVDVARGAVEGPFGNHTGYYAPAGPAALFTLRGQYQRDQPCCPATVVGPPPQEDLHLAELIARLWLPLLRCDFPALVDLALPPVGIFHGCALLAVADGAGDGGELLRALWQTPIFRRSRLLVLLDAATDVHDPALSFWRILNQCDPARDLLQDGGRIGLDARGRDLGPRLTRPAALRDAVRARWSAYGLGGLPAPD